jgi:hypothetical protein
VLRDEFSHDCSRFFDLSRYFVKMRPCALRLGIVEVTQRG